MKPPTPIPPVSPLTLLAHQDAACRAIDTDIQSLVNDRERLDALIGALIREPGMRCELGLAPVWLGHDDARADIDEVFLS